MSAGKIWMGVRGYEQWVPAPSIGGDWSSIGWSKSLQLRNGGSRVSNSRATHKEYNMSWGLGSRDSLRAIMDMYSGIYGVGLIYFLDPFAADKNALPVQWAFPGLACADGVPLVGNTRPEAITTTANTLGYPITSAKYLLTGVAKKVYVPIPPGYTAWVGVYGEVVGTGGVQVTAITPGSMSGPTTLLTMLAVTDTTRFNASFDGNTYNGVELTIVAGTSTSITLSGMMVQVLPTASVPATGGFISGQGNSGCKFETAPSQTAYSAGIDKIGMTAKLIEVGTWV